MGSTENGAKKEKLIVAYDSVFDCFYNIDNGKILKEEVVIMALKYKFQSITFDANFLHGLKILMETQHLKLNLMNG